ncbi:MAG: hypothetical protein AAFZ18_37400 [Myxococcota bacterium]
MSVVDDLLDDERLDELTQAEPKTPILGVGKMAQQLGMKPGQRWGKWCSQCQGLWFGLGQLIKAFVIQEVVND